VGHGLAGPAGPLRRALYHLEVEPAHRRRGVGRLLVAECLKQARAQAMDRLLVQTEESNGPALALYRNLGFQACGRSVLYRLPGS
jgi:ribosomal-protein-alanine N-acetyltransferase